MTGTFMSCKLSVYAGWFSTVRGVNDAANIAGAPCDARAQAAQLCTTRDRRETETATFGSQALKTQTCLGFAHVTFAPH